MNKKKYSKLKINNIIQKYNIKRKNKKKKLVICHGHKHKKKFNGCLLLNRSDIEKPNIVSNAWSDKEMKYLPEKYFDEILMEYCPLGNPFSKNNNQLWKNLYRILKKDGKITNSSILPLFCINTKQKWYFDMNKTEQNKAKIEVNKNIKKLGFKRPKHKKNIFKIPKTYKFEKSNYNNYV